MNTSIQAEITKVFTEEELVTMYEELIKYKPNHGAIADYFMVLHGEDIKNVVGKGFYKWTGKFWEYQSEGFLHTMIQNFLRDHEKACSHMVMLHSQSVANYTAGLSLAATEDDTDMIQISLDGAKQLLKTAKVYAKAYTISTSNTIQSLVKLVEHNLAVKVQTLNAGTIFNFQNGVYNVVTDEFTAHDKRFFNDYVFDYEYNKDALCPIMDRVMEEWLPDEPTRNVLEEYMGYTLIDDCRFQKILCLIGEGANGKSVFLSTMINMLSPVSLSVNLETFGTDYNTGKIAGKKLVTSSESGKTNHINEEFWKAASASERLTVREISKDPYEIEPTAKLIWTTNHRPNIQDTSNGIWRRLIVIPFSRIYTPEEQDGQLTTKLKGELSGIFNKSVKGLRRLLDQNGFSKSEIIESYNAKYKLDQNPVANFVLSLTSTSETEKYLLADVLNIYNKWNRTKNGVKFDTTVKTFKSELERMASGYPQNALTVEAQKQNIFVYAHFEDQSEIMSLYDGQILKCYKAEVTDYRVKTPSAFNHIWDKAKIQTEVVVLQEAAMQESCQTTLGLFVNHSK